MHFDTKKLTRCALIAAIYVALTMLSNALNLAYGPIQLRFLSVSSQTKMQWKNLPPDSDIL